MASRARGSAKIRPPKKMVNDVQFDDSWRILSQAYEQIYRKNASSLSFEELYRNAYTLVLTKNGERLYKNMQTVVAEHLQEVTQSQIWPLCSASNTASVSDGRIQNEHSLQFLRILKEAWEDHHLCMSMMSDVLMYMDRVYAKQANVPLFYEAGTALFREHVVRSHQFPIAQVLVNVILQQIHLERSGDIIDRPTIKACISMLETLPDSGRTGDTVYQVDFEEPILAATREFYSLESDALLSNCTASEYLIKTNKRLQEEYERSQNCLTTSSEAKLRDIVEEELIAKNLRLVVEKDTGLKHMIENEKVDDLTNLYNLSARVDSELTDLKIYLSREITANGTEINRTILKPQAALSGESFGAKSADEKLNPTALAMKWVEDVLDLKDRYERILVRAMSNDMGIQTAMTNAFNNFINENERSSEFISLFIDDHMKKGLKGKTEDEVETILNKTIILFRYISDKDVFERYYKGHLARRLLMGRSISDDAERAMITKMKVEVGYTFTAKLEGMFKDMKLSQDMMSDYKDYIQSTQTALSLEMTTQVLTSTFWPVGLPTADGGVASCTFSSEVEDARQTFQRFYLSRHSGRQLTWVPSMGSADIRATFNKRKHELNVTTFAMAILLLFNDLEDGESLSYTDIKNATSIPDNELIRNLQSLSVAMKHRILLKEPMSREVKPDDRFTFNHDFQSQYTRIKVNVVAGSKLESESERKDTMEKVDAMRNIQIEAAIVRIMKDRKLLDHNNLVAEVTKQLAGRFLPSPAGIKKRIEGLIEREYLEREGTNRYKYLVRRNGIQS